MYVHEWANIFMNRMVGSNTHLQSTQWSFGAKVTIWQMATSTQRTIMSNASVRTLKVQGTKEIQMGE